MSSTTYPYCITSPPLRGAVAPLQIVPSTSTARPPLRKDILDVWTEAPHLTVVSPVMIDIKRLLVAIVFELLLHVGGLDTCLKVFDSWEELRGLEDFKIESVAGSVWL